VVDRSVRRCDGYHRGGEAEAHRKLETFLAARLDRYAAHRNDPGLGLQSHLSPHVHYGQISVVYLTYRALRVAREGAREREQGNRNDGAPPEASSPYRPSLPPSLALRRGVDKYLDELVIRRELAVNFVLHEPRYDRYEGVPQWARRSLAEHAGDARKHVYTLEQFEACRTHDALWNACQREIVVSGKMHNYVRMFWCKKILEWSASPEEAWRIAIHLNNKYGLDGRDPVSYTGVGWCFGLHDRPFPEADVTGATRRMSENGMRGKFRDGVAAYARKWGEPGDRAGSNPGAKRRASSAAADPATPTHAANAGGRQMRLKEMFGKRPRMR
jgi:deoxyribodipyrimidine photo-lyase